VKGNENERLFTFLFFKFINLKFSIMNKKFLSVILFSALMVGTAGTFTSCKDYDDDIENLQGQIDKLATKEDMTSQIAALQAALDAAKTEAAAAKTSAEEAVKKANDAASTATEAEKAAAQAALDAANAKTEAIKAAQDEVAKVKAQLESTIDSKFDAAKKELAATINELTEKVTKLTGLTTDMITSLELQTANPVLALNYAQLPAKLNPNTSVKDAKSYEFGKGFTGSFTINANEIYTTPASFMISVAPVNAVVTNEMFSLINSKGEALSDVTLSTEAYDGLLTKSVSNGLYEVKVELNKEADLDAFGKKVVSEEKDVLFALAATKDTRTVTSTYDITAKSEKKAYRKAEKIAENSTIQSTVEAKKPLEGYENPATTTRPNNEKCYPVASGEAFQINVAAAEESYSGALSNYNSPIMASYVVVDIDNKALSTTDKAAIKSLTIAGVETVSKDNKFDITISGAYAKGVVVPLKVITIDYTGTEQSVVVWVKAGNGSEIASEAKYVITPTAYVDAPATYDYAGLAKFTVPAGADKFDLSIFVEDEIDIKENEKIFDGTVFTFYKADGTKATKIEDIANAKLAATVDLQTMKNDKVYEGIVKFFDAEGTFLSQSTISVQKVLPTTLPEGFSIKTNQLDAQGVYNCYLIPNDWTAKKATEGTMEMKQVFNFGKGEAKDYLITFAAAKVDGDKTVDNGVTGAGKLSVAEKYIDNKTQHATTVVYNYGQISSEKKDGAFVNYTIDAASFPTVFNCIYNDTYTWRWATKDDLGLKATATLPYSTELTYGEGETVEYAKYIKGISSRDSEYSALLSKPYEESLEIKEAHLVSNANGEVDEYFTVNIEEGKITGFTVNSEATNPTAAVPSTLKITVVDMYKHERVIELGMTVNKR
jgi:multidrug efflux pump subunit AcrA (membrane-fusion protein)